MTLLLSLLNPIFLPPLYEALIKVAYENPNF